MEYSIRKTEKGYEWIVVLPNGSNEVSYYDYDTAEEADNAVKQFINQYNSAPSNESV